MTAEIFKHKSGIEIIIDKNDSPLIGVNFRVNVGSINEDDNQRGISHFIEHMLFTGTSNFSKEQIVKNTELTGAYVNAYTSFDNTTYTVKCMTTNFKMCLSIISDMLTDCQFFEEHFQKEKGVILQEISDRCSNPNIVVYDEFFKKFFKDDGMKTAVIGTKETVSNFTREDLLSYYKKYYIPKNMILSVAGNIEKDMILSVLDEYFPNGKDGSVTHEKTLTVTTENDFTYNNDFQQDNIIWAFPLPHPHSSKIDQIRNIVNISLGDGFSSILFKTIRDNLGLVYSIGSYIYSVGKNNILLINTTCDADKSERIYEELPKSMQMLKSFNQETLNDCKNMAKFNVSNSYESRTGAAANNLSVYKYYGKLFTYDEDISCIENITLEECQIFIDELLSIKPVKFISKSSKQKEV